jgi:hypothetical protein
VVKFTSSPIKSKSELEVDGKGCNNLCDPKVGWRMMVVKLVFYSSLFSHHSICNCEQFQER